MAFKPLAAFIEDTPTCQLDAIHILTIPAGLPAATATERPSRSAGWSERNVQRDHASGLEAGHGSGAGLQINANNSEDIVLPTPLSRQLQDISALSTPKLTGSSKRALPFDLRPSFLAIESTEEASNDEVARLYAQGTASASMAYLLLEAAVQVAGRDV